MQFDNRDEVKLWIIRNQEGRRNLTDGWRYKLAQTKKAVLVDIGKVKYKETVGRPSKESLSIVDNDLPKHDTRKVIAADLGWSTGEAKFFKWVDAGNKEAKFFKWVDAGNKSETTKHNAG